MSIEQSAIMFAREIKKTKEFINLKKAKMEIDKNPALKNEVKSLLKDVEKTFTTKGNKTNGIEVDRKLKKLSEKKPVSEYMKAGKEFNKLMQRSLKSIYTAINPEITIK